MPLNMGSVTRVLRGEKQVENAHGVQIWAKRGGWSEVVLRRDGETLRFNVRSPRARMIAAQGKMRYSDVGDRLYSEWIKGTKAGAMHTSRRQVEGMLKTALRKGDRQMAEELTEVLGKSDAKVDEFYNEWLAEMSDADIEEYYSYDTSASDFPSLLDRIVGRSVNGPQNSGVR